MMRSLKNTIQSINKEHEAWFSIIFVMIFGILAYVPLMSKLGFYRDDWYMLWAGHIFGPQAIVDLFAFDRPFVGFVYSGSYGLLGENPLSWQVYTFVVRAAGTVGFLWIARRLWPERRIETTTAAILFFIYPGFLQWANANTKSNQITTYTIAILSICLTVAAMQAKSIRWKIPLTVGAVLLAVCYWFLYEYMIGMEGMRLGIIILFITREHPINRKLRIIIDVIKNWLAYLFPLILSVAWRVFFFESGRQGMNVQLVFSAYGSNPLKVLAKRILVLIIDFYDTLISAWVVPLNNITFKLESTELLLAMMLGILGIGFFISYFILATSTAPKQEDVYARHRSLLEITSLGGFTLFCTLVPVIAVGRDIRWDSGFDKYALHVIAGVVLLIVGAISFLIRSNWKSGLFSALIGIALATQFGNAIEWAEFWDDQKNLWWQLSWRAPQLEHGTVLLVEPPEMGFFEDYEVWGPANLIYSPYEASPRIFAEVYTPSTLEKIRVGSIELTGLRDFAEFTRNFNDSLILSRPARTSCWHIIDGSDPVFPENTSGMLYSTFRISSIDQIDFHSSQISPPTHMFGPEPEHTWCYFYQKAELATQEKNWEAAARLADQALDNNFKPIDRSEWLPFLKGLVMEGRDGDAEAMAVWIRDVPVIRHRQCDYLSNTALPDPDRQAYLREILCN